MFLLTETDTRFVFVWIPILFIWNKSSELFFFYIYIHIYDFSYDFFFFLQWNSIGTYIENWVRMMYTCLNACIFPRTKYIPRCTYPFGWFIIITLPQMKRKGLLYRSVFFILFNQLRRFGIISFLIILSQY